MKTHGQLMNQLLIFILICAGFISCTSNNIETSNNYPYFEDYRAANFSRLSTYLTFDDFGSYDNPKKYWMS